MTEIDELRARLLELGQPVIIPANEQVQPSSAADNPPQDIIIKPYCIKEV